MDMKKIKPDVKFIGINVVIAVVIAIVLLVILLSRLRSYTEHGQEVEVPNVTGMYLEEAGPILEAEGLRAEIIDSTFSDKVPLGSIVEQNPQSGSHVKHGRAIYLIMNARFRPQVMLPELYDLSYRQAIATLNGLGIGVEEIVYEPSEYKDLVLDIRRGEESLPVGSKVEEGEQLVLVVGRGMGTEMVKVPDLKGKSLQDARSYLRSLYLTMGTYTYDEEPTEENIDQYVVIQQTPQAGEQVLEGTRVDMKLSTNIEKAFTVDTKDNEEDFF